MMKVITSLQNRRTRERISLGKLPNPIPVMRYKKTDELYLKCKVTNFSLRTVDLRIEFWLGNRLIDSVGRDSVDHVSQVQKFVKQFKSVVLGKFFTVADRDDNATITVGTLFDYTKTDHRNIRIELASI